MSPSALLPSDSVVTADVVPLLQKYAEDVNSAVKVINSYCSSEGLPHPSFDLQAPKSTIPPTAPLNVQLARQSLIASANAIQQLAKEPADYLPHLAIHVCPPSLLNANFPPYSYGLDLRHLLAVIESHIVSFTDPQFQYQYLACLHWLCHFDILKHIPEKPIAYAELASIAGVPELQLRSVVRMINTSNFLCEPNPDHVAHNAVSRLFVTNSSLMDWANYMAQYSAPAAASFAKATAKWGKTDRKDQTAFSIATDFTGTLFEYYAQSPELANCFASYMRSVQSSQGTSLRHLLTGYDWAVLSKALVVDVGGSTCSSSIALAEAFPDLTFTVEDLPDTISNSSAILSGHPESSRINTQAYDFFTPQPVHGSDVYLMRMILHDWPSADAVTILKNQLSALKVKPSSRLVIMDTVLPRPGSISSVEEALLRVRDLTMIQSFNSKERELGEFEELFAQASDESGCLVLKNIVKPPGSVMSVMEVAYQPYDRNGVVSNGVH